MNMDHGEKGVHDELIIQSVAGSGKTSVALHRVAYLHRSENQEDEALPYVRNSDIRKRSTADRTFLSFDAEIWYIPFN
ncbi:hypothetical protein [Cohnella boryungensis]|uniref:DNA helicase n=1 Tax=Cohnella boryungensis TaxID=768479 RepID=A0ABV8SDC0_9BACL